MTPSKVRIYELAKELKQEPKRIIEEVRREGVDVSVPSNTISKEIAEKIRNRYLPPKEKTALRPIRVVKRHHAPAEADAASSAVEAGEHTLEELPPLDGDALTSEPTTAPTLPADGETPATARPFAARLVKKLAPAARAEQPAGAADAPVVAAPLETPEVEQSPQMEADEAPEQVAPSLVTTSPLDAAPPEVTESSQLISETELAVEVEPETEAMPLAASTDALPSAETTSRTPPAAPDGTTTTVLAPSRQVRVLRPTAAAHQAGIVGQRVPVPTRTPPPAAPTPRERDRRSGGRGDERGGARPADGRGRPFQREEGLDMRGTPGETATPQTTYIPPADARRQRHGRSSRPGAAAGAPVNPRAGGGKDRGKRGFERDFVQPHRALSLEDRIAGSIHGEGGEMRPYDTGGADALRPIRLIEGATVKEFAEKLGIKPKDVVAVLIKRGVFATVNQTLNHEVAVELGRRFGFDVSFVDFEESVVEEEFEDLIARDADDVELPRAPVVTVMGHVDHGKTSLLDAIRATDVASGEAGGITQHIGAYSVSVASPDNPAETRRVVFIDTPGHEAFTMMRARGAKVTDVVVLVVAADDGVMQQTVEAIEHARAAGVPIVVAINKIDRPDANADRVRQELATQGLQPVEWGGDIEMVPVSAKRRENLDTLLETILLTADLLNLRASPTRLSSGVVLEVKRDKGRGTVATVLVQQGTLRVGDPFIVGQVFGKVRAMFNDRGERILEVGPATPVEVLGLEGVPQAGDPLQVVSDITRAQQISSHRQEVTRQNTLLQTTKRGIEALGERDVKELLVVIKADVQGSVEVLKGTLQKLSTEQVKVRVLRSGVGAITESDVMLAAATQAEKSSSAVVIIGFNVRPEMRAAELAKQEHVDIRLHSIIYKVEEEIRAAMIGMLEAIERERILGKADVREVFRVPRVGAVAGCMVVDGTIRRNARARLIRDGVVSWEGNIASLRRFKDDVSEVRQGFDCGIGLENFNDVKVGDQIEAYIIEKVAATEL